MCFSCTGPDLLIFRHVGVISFFLHYFSLSALYKTPYKQQGRTDHLNTYNSDLSVHKMLSNV